MKRWPELEGAAEGAGGRGPETPQMAPMLGTDEISNVGRWADSAADVADAHRHRRKFVTGRLVEAGLQTRLKIRSRRSTLAVRRLRRCPVSAARLSKDTVSGANVCL